MSKNSSVEYVKTGKGLGYYDSADVYKDNVKIGSIAHRANLSGRTYTDVYDADGKKIDSHYD